MIDKEWIITNAALSSDVYNDNLNVSDQLKGWTRIHSTPEVVISGYFGAAYIDSIDNPSKIIIAHRGTNNIQDIIEDIAIINNRPFSQLFDAACFTKKVLRVSPRDCTISHTGHSLGAIIAEIMSYMTFGSRKCITFENPGSLEILKRWLINENPDISAVKKYSTIIQSRVNMIDTCNTQMGTVYNLKDKPLGIDADILYPKSYLENPYYMVANTLEQHPISSMLTYLEEGGIIAPMDNWPSGFEAGYKVFLKEIGH